jgi:hypothetical protein
VRLYAGEGDGRYAAWRDARNVYIYTFKSKGWTVAPLERERNARQLGLYRWKVSIKDLVADEELLRFLVHHGLFDGIEPTKTKLVYLSRLVVCLAGGRLRWKRRMSKDEKLEVHHIDGNSENDRIENLRVLTKREHDAYHERVGTMGASASRWDVGDAEEATAPKRLADLVLPDLYTAELSPPRRVVGAVVDPAERLREEMAKPRLKRPTAFFIGPPTKVTPSAPYTTMARVSGSRGGYGGGHARGIPARGRGPPLAA